MQEKQMTLQQVPPSPLPAIRSIGETTRVRYSDVCRVLFQTLAVSAVRI